MTDAMTVADAFDQVRSRSHIMSTSDMFAGRFPLYSKLFRLIAEDDELFELALLAPPGQLVAWMLPTVVHYLLLSKPDDALAAYYPSISPAPKSPEDVKEDFVRFCREHREEICKILKTRTLQTTFPARAGGVLFALDHVARAVGGPLSIIEVGCSAGLLLLFDHYRYELDDGVSLGDPDAPVTIQCSYVGDRPRLPQAIPDIKRRVGLDLAPLDPSDPDALRWVLACFTPDRSSEFQQLRAALEYRGRTPLETITGDALQTLPEVLASVEGPVCVYHSQCLYQWPPEARDKFGQLLADLSCDRDIYRVGIEFQDYLQRATRLPSIITLTHYSRGQTTEKILGAAEVMQSVISWNA